MKTKPLTAEDVELSIDKAFDSILPPASKYENDDLKMSVAKGGQFFDPIRFWKSGDKALIVDGHRRFKMWNDLLLEGKSIAAPRVEEMTFASRDDVTEWIREMQCSRRNVPARTLSLLRGRWAIDKSAKPNIRQSAENSPGRPRKAKSQAAKAVAEKAGVSVRTVTRDMDFANAVDRIGRINRKAKQDIESGALKLPRETVIGIGALPPEEIGAALVNVRMGRAWDQDATPAAAPVVEPNRIGEARDAVKQLGKIMVDGVGSDAERRKLATELRKIADRIDPPAESNGKFHKPTVADVAAYCTERENHVDAQTFVDFYESKGWAVGKAKMKDWRACVRTWKKERSNGSTNGHAKGINDAAFAEVFGSQR